MTLPIRVLLVDDEKTFWEPMSQQLTRSGLHVDVATSGKQVLEKAKKSNGDYQVAVIDQVMGPPNGTKIMLALRQLYPGIETIILTGWGDMEPGEDAMKLGAYSYLSKPVKANELSLNIRCAARFGLEQQKRLSLQRLVLAGQRIGGAQNEGELYQQIYAEVMELLPDLGGFLISQYDELLDVINFPFCHCRGKQIELPSRKLGNSLTAYVLRKREPLLLPNGDNVFRKEQKLDPPDPRLGFKKSLIVAPIFLDKRIIGTITALTYKENTHFTPEHLQIFQAFANQAAPAIRNVQQLIEAKQLKDAVSALTSKRGRKAVIKAIVEEAHKLIACDFTGLILQDEDGTLHKVRPVIPASHYDQFDEPRQQGGVTKFVVQSRKHLVIRDTQVDMRVKETVRAEGVRSMLIFPLCYGDLVIGVLYGHSFSTLNFSDHDVELWAAFATQAAVVLYNAFEAEQRSEDFKRLEQITAALVGNRDLRSTMKNVATAAKNIFGSNICRLAYIEPTTQRIVNWAWANNTPENYRIDIDPRPNGFTNRVLQTKKPIFYSVVDKNGPEPIEELVNQGLHYSLSIPLFISGRLVGVLHCNYLDKQEPAYDRLKILIPAFSARAAIALYRSRRDRLNKIWHNLNQKIVTCTNLKDLYREFVRHAHQASGADFSVFYPFDPTRTEENNGMTIRDDIIYEGRLEQPWEEPAGGQGGGVIEALMHSRDGLLIVNDLDCLEGKYASRLSARQGVKAFVAVRLRVIMPGSETPKLAGILFHNYCSRTAFEKADLVNLRSAGASVAQGILRLNLQSALQKAFEERKNLLSAITDILHAFEREGKELDPTMIAKQVVQVLGFSACTILEYDYKSERFIRRGIAGVRHPDRHYTIPREYKTRYMDIQHATVIANVQEDEFFQSSNYCQMEDIKSSVIFPLLVDGKALGILFADNRSDASLPQETITALGLFADFAALLLHESQLSSELDSTNNKLSRRMFLVWVSMLEDTWRHELVQRASTILNYAGSLKMLLERASSLPEVMKNVPSMIATINKEAHEIADAPPRVPQSWEAEPELLPLAPLLEEVGKRESKSPLPGTGPLLRVQFNLDALGGVQVRGHRRWLIYALEALIKNSRKAMPRGGTITITGKRTAEWVEVRIQDTGDGIPKEIRSRLFRELIPPKDDKKGMGIGGLLVATIIEIHDGEVSIDKPGPGDTTILIRLPYVKE